jgi:hypothetical protein
MSNNDDNSQHLLRVTSIIKSVKTIVSLTIEICEAEVEFEKPMPQELGEALRVLEELIAHLLANLNEMRISYDEREEEYEKLEQAVQKGEQDIRMHIRVYISYSFDFS